MVCGTRHTSSAYALNCLTNRFVPLTKPLCRGLRFAPTTSVFCGFRPTVSLTAWVIRIWLTASSAVENVMAIINSAAPLIDFPPQEYQRLIEKYLDLSKQNDQLVKAIRSGDQVDIDHVRHVLQTDFPLFARLQDYFSRLRVEGLKSVEQTFLISDDPVSAGIGIPSRSIDVGMEGRSEMQLVSEFDPGAMSAFLSMAGSAFTERPSAVPNQGPFGIQFSDYPPRVISQMLLTYTDVVASSCKWFPPITLRACPHYYLVAPWRGLFTWAGFERASRAKKFMRVPMVGLNAAGGKDLYAKKKLPQRNLSPRTLTPTPCRLSHTWPQNMILLPSGVKRVNNAALEEWIKRYDPVWCQFVPHHNKGGDGAVMNDLVSRQLVQRLMDQCLVGRPVSLP